MSDVITVLKVKELNKNGQIAYPYPRLLRISVNGGASRPATKAACIEARKFLDQSRQNNAR